MTEQMYSWQGRFPQKAQVTFPKFLEFENIAKTRKVT